MNILFVAPYPPSRIRSRSYGFIQHLRQEHTITVLSQVTTQQEQKDVETLRALGYEVVAVPESKQQSLLRSGFALFSSYPIQVAYARSSRFLQAMRQLCAQRSFDVIHVEHLRAIGSIEPLLKDYPLVWDAVDCMSSLWKQTSTVGANGVMRAFSALEYTRTEKYEAHFINNQTHISVISEVDRQAMLALFQKRYPQSTNIRADALVEVISNGVDADYFIPTQEKYRPYNIVFSGKMSYHANVAAVHYLYQDIMPLIWQAQPAATLTIVGSNPPKSIQKLTTDSRVEVTGYVDDIRPYIRRAHIMMSPMVYSVGMQLKVLEAMALGTPAVISPQSARALSALPGRDMFVAGSPDEFAYSAIQLMNDTDLRTTVGLYGRRYIEQQHDWHVITGKLVNLYQRVINEDIQQHTIAISANRSTSASRKNELFS
jgi:sugar transferase (PEP-CTERM/EpsH1 system associated)